MSRKKRLLITLSGCVQGVGFRPFVYRLAEEHGLAGHIRNTSQGVQIDVQGEEAQLSAFQKALVAKKPERASITQMEAEEAPLSDAESFTILSSDATTPKTELALLPDTSICSLCLQELYDPCNRRYRYPFIHCMSCGPRFSLFVRMPFDRDNTTMVDFLPCTQCQAEYQNPSDRRFYSQTNCCPTCGPKLMLYDSEKRLLAGAEQAIEQAASLLQEGKIVALKNTGGFLLLADASCEATVQRLRKLKKRPRKPFALLMPSLEVAKGFVSIDPAAEALLISPAAPIVLLEKKKDLAPSVAFAVPSYGIMLPHNALHHLLLERCPKPLVATSGNRAGSPICIDEMQAFAQLGSIADAFLVHNRRIVHRMDDSVVQIIDGKPMILRRARGYIPYTIQLPKSLPIPLFAAGGHLKNSFAFAHEHKLYLSQHMGDLDSEESYLAYTEEVKSWETLLNLSPTHAVGDLHPDYATSHYLRERALPTSSIQHHKAHVHSTLCDNQLAPPFLALSWDGTGWGEDRTIWGSEAFLVTAHGMERLASLAPFRLPGGEKAVKEPRRALLGLLHALFGKEAPPLSSFRRDEQQILLASLDRKINAPLCSSMGRLFDAVSALLTDSFVNHFEGEAALALETLANRAEKSSRSYSLPLQKRQIQWQQMLQQMLESKAQGAPLAAIALAFHNALADTIVQLAQRASLKTVLLTGGCMQNRRLLETAIDKLREAGFCPFWPQQIPPNDGGLAIGQLVGAAFKISRRIYNK